MKCLLTLLLLLSTTVVAQDAGTGAATCPVDSGPDVATIARLASSWDAMHDELLTSAGPADHRTRFGTVLDEACFAGLNATQRQARIDRLEAGLAGAISQMRGCGQTLGIVESTDVISVLRRTRLICQSLGPTGMGQMQMSYSCAFAPPGSQLRMSAGATHRFEMLLATPAAGASGASGDASFERWPLEDLSAVLAHEAMHVLAMNNRQWHNSLEGRAKRGCENSILTDRVYFTEAACFPRSRGGQALYGEPGAVAQCPGVCEAALTETDPEVAATDRADSLTATHGVFGPSDRARPYPTAEAARLCARVRASHGVIPPATGP